MPARVDAVPVTNFVRDQMTMTLPRMISILFGDARGSAAQTALWTHRAMNHETMVMTMRVSWLGVARMGWANSAHRCAFRCRSNAMRKP